MGLALKPLHRCLSQVLQAMGYPTGFDSDLDPMSSDERSDGEGKSETTTTNAGSHATHSSDSSNTLEVGWASFRTSRPEQQGRRWSWVVVIGPLVHDSLVSCDAEPHI